MPDTEKYIAELEDIAARMAALSSEAKADDLKRATEALDGVVDGVHKSWSGSNIGYHARVYYQDYQTPPPDDMFNKEWGLMFGGEGRGWVIHADDDEVKEDIFCRAGVDNLNESRSEVPRRMAN
ncbi:hypothetical protein M4D79_10830 [Mycolicibacterium novocastrense]|nr:hypothetical protein M4D79_10830 [Mycolicibacterium novocastrense]